MTLDFDLLMQCFTVEMYGDVMHNPCAVNLTRRMRQTKKRAVVMARVGGLMKQTCSNEIMIIFLY